MGKVLKFEPRKKLTPEEEAACEVGKILAEIDLTEDEWTAVRADLDAMEEEDG